MKSLRIGLVGEGTEAQELLEQIGSPYKIVDFNRPFSLEDFSVMVIARELASQENKFIEKFVAGGGSVLHDYNACKGSVLHDYNACEKGFVGGKTGVPEVVSFCHKGKNTFDFIRLLTEKFEGQGLPFVHKWFYPKKFDSAFGFHVDVDFDYRPDTKKAIDVLKHKKAVWFVNCEAAKADKTLLNLLGDEIVGNHNFKHEFFGSKEDYGNIIASDKFFKVNGLQPKGFCAPNGLLNEHMISALVFCGYEYAVGFGAGYDCLPFHLKGKTLLIGIHPICIEILKTRDFNGKQMADYFKTAFGRNLRNGVPCFFYGHPFKAIARFPGVVLQLFEYAEKCNVWMTNVEEFSQWWLKREESDFDAFFDGDKVFIKTGNNNKDFSIRILFKGKEAIVGMEEAEYSIKGIEMKKANNNFESGHGKIGRVGIKFMLKKSIGKALEMFKKGAFEWHSH